MVGAGEGLERNDHRHLRRRVAGSPRAGRSRRRRALASRAVQPAVGRYSQYVISSPVDLREHRDAAIRGREAVAVAGSGARRASGSRGSRPAAAVAAGAGHAPPAIRREGADGTGQRASVGASVSGSRQHGPGPAAAQRSFRASAKPTSRPLSLVPEASAASATRTSAAISSESPACSTVAEPRWLGGMPSSLACGEPRNGISPVGAPGVPVQERPSRASRTSVTASGKTIRIASRTWTACSSLAPLRSRVADRGDRHVDGELDRVVGPGDLLRALHLLGHVGEPRPELVRVAEEAEGVSAFHTTRIAR